MQGTGVVNQVAGLVIVGTIYNQIVAVQLFHDIGCIEFFFFGDEFNILVDVFYFVLSRCNLGALDISCAMQHLTLQVF